MPYKNPLSDAAIASNKARQKRYYEKNKARILADPERKRRVAENSRAYHRKHAKRRTEQARLRRGFPPPSRPEPAGCEICGGPPIGKDTCLHFDRVHATGVFRGWLCGHCNRAIGLFKDDPNLCEAAARYLRVAALL